MTKRAIYPGTFDPLTYGHIDIIKRASRIFAEVIVAVAESPQKEPLFSLLERMEMLKSAVGKFPGVKVESFSGLIIDFAKQKKTHIVIRGLRMISDFEYEFQMALTNRKLAANLETIFLMPSETYAYLSATLIKEAARLGADLSAFVPPAVAKELRRKLR
jgi:pantetheine-phosphate adenylyltransferase